VINPTIDQMIEWLTERIDASLRAPNSNIVIHREKAAHIRNALVKKQADEQQRNVPSLDYEMACESFKEGAGESGLSDEDICQGIRCVLRDQDVAIASAHKIRAALTDKQANTLPLDEVPEGWYLSGFFNKTAVAANPDKTWVVTLLKGMQLRHQAQGVGATPADALRAAIAATANWHADKWGVDDTSLATQTEPTP